MAYEKLVVYAIDRNDMKAFPHRFRIFPNKDDRDRTLGFLNENSPPQEAGRLKPVKLTVLIEGDDILELPWEWAGEG